MDKIRYKSDGTIFTKPENEDFEHDINEILKLNGEKDKDSNIIHDSSTELVKINWAAKISKKESKN